MQTHMGVGGRVSSFKLQATRKSRSVGGLLLLQAASCKLQAASCKLQAASYKLQATSYKRQEKADPWEACFFLRLST
ncbi:hypothetical protein, partial [Pseudomonas juntendi]|uniref:hypothetical protein n=1 Tax=Pseudomonas juntendi TaxID=2666183 RepID=UPI001C711A46